MTGWAVVLDGVALVECDGALFDTSGYGEVPYGSDVYGGGEVSVPGYLTQAPDGLGVPNIRTEDVSYPQRDGVRHFSDWYDPRIITLNEVSVESEDCDSCPDVRQKVRDIVSVWRRRCDDTELVIFTDCHGEGDPSLTGPFGVVGRPRMAPVEWVSGPLKAARMTLRFDAVDHFMYVLDESGEPGSGSVCEDLIPGTVTLLRCYDVGQRCYPRCYTEPTGDPGGPETMTNIGTECVPITITLNPTLTDPFVENVTTGDRINYAGTIVGTPVIIDTATGTATQGGQSRTHLISGDIRMLVQPGDNTLRLGSFNSDDTGTAEVCFRPAVIMA